MPVRHLLPFALPTGRDKNIGRLTVCFSPRLKDRRRLLRYPEWLDWPDTLANRLAPLLQVEVDGAVAAHTQVSVAPSSAVWRAVFGPDTPVEAHRFVDFSTTPIQPMASSDFSEAVLDLYVALARTSPDGPPSGSDLLALAAAAGLPLDGSGGSGPGPLAEAAAYRAPMEDAAEDDEDDELGPRFDFHASLSLLGHHPELLRHLGLAIDLEVELTGSPSQVQVIAGYGGPDRFEIPMVTLTTPAFLARPNPAPDNNEQEAGFLTLATEKAFLSIVDPHLAAARLTAAAQTATEHDDGTLPALATRALTLVRPDVTNAFANRTIRQRDLEAALQKFLDGTGGPVVLFAEDITIGHRIDVLDGGKWRSLFERQSDAGYVFPKDAGLEIVPGPDEGWNTLLLVTEQEDVRPPINEDEDLPIKPTALFRLDDAMYRWDGWSGAAPPPSSTLDGTTGLPVAKDANQPDADQAAQVAVDYRVVPGSLPRLRFGRTYRMRARCVDLAGNSRPLAARSPAGSVVPPEPFGRLEPIAAPIVVRRSPRPTPGVGDTPYELVLRSDYDVADEKVTAIDRLLFPGRVGQDLCELHDLPVGGADPASYALLAARDALDLTDQTVSDPVTGEIVAGVVGSSRGVIVPGPTRQDVEYLSDPAIGAARFGFPSLGSAETVPVPGAWPERQSVRVVVAAGEQATVVAPDAETDLQVFVPKAEIVPIAATFAIEPSFLEHFGLWPRMTAEEQARLEAAVVGGAHWMFTPARTLTLVHAVRRPLLAPAVSELEGGRSLGSSAIVLKGTLVAHDKSTERVTMTAGWTDTVDDVALGAPVLRSTRVELGNLLMPRGDGTNKLSVNDLRSELHDTKRHLATVDLEAFSSFASYFTEETAVTVTATDEPVVLDTRGVVVGTVEVTLPATGERAVAGVDFIVGGTSNTIMFLAGGALAVGDRPTVRYVALPISRTSTEPESPPPFVLLFPNTAVPPPPSVESVIPAFARGQDGAGSHSGQVLRVYLDRPWLVTGDGEQLAVILDPPSVTPPTLTTVGRDPIVGGPGPGAGPVAADFPRAVSVAEGVDGVHDVAGHAVAFDAASGRWFADIELAPTFGYRPFLRLTVARYQPDSIDGAMVSSFVTLEPVRLGVVRWVAVTRSGATADVEVKGVDALGNAVQATVEDADPSIADPDLRWRPVGDPIRLTPTIAGDEASWSGVVDLARTAAPLRVVIEELEPGFQDVDGVETPVETVVYVEAVELPPA
ncbi:MAG: hypothetical protein ACRD0A_10105 [Acidimicrobiales bacterium]